MRKTIILLCMMLLATKIVFGAYPVLEYNFEMSLIDPNLPDSPDNILISGNYLYKEGQVRERRAIEGYKSTVFFADGSAEYFHVTAPFFAPDIGLVTESTITGNARADRNPIRIELSLDDTILYTINIPQCVVDGICAEYEDELSCPADCAIRGRIGCGNGICESWESVSTCPEDCTQNLFQPITPEVVNPVEPEIRDEQNTLETQERYESETAIIPIQEDESKSLLWWYLLGVGIFFLILTIIHKGHPKQDVSSVEDSLKKAGWNSDDIARYKK